MSDSKAIKLASAGEVVKIWDSNTYKICFQLPTKDLSLFQSVHWSSDCTQTVSVPVEGEKIFLSLLKTNLPQHVELPMKGCSVAKFCSTSPRFLGLGYKGGSVTSWDLKYKKPKMTFNSTSHEVTCIQFNAKDTCIAAGYDNGSIIVYSTLSNLSSRPYISNSSERINDLTFSYIKKSLLGCCSQDGSVSFWDTCSQQLYKYFCEHKAPVTGIRFSPANSYLSVSVGLDKNICFYDIKTKKVVRTIAGDSPLCSVDFKEDGYTLAVGCSRGRIYFYDLRKSNFATHTIHAHTTSVQSLAFQNSIADREKKSLKVEVSKYESHENLFDSTSYSKSKIGLESPPSWSLEFNRDDLKSRKESLTGDIFSPIRESFVQGPEVSRNVKNSTVFENQSFSFAAISPLQNTKVSEKDFSLKENDISLANMSRRKPETSFTLTPNKEESTSLKQQILKAALSPQTVTPLSICSRSANCAENLWPCNGSAMQKENLQESEIILEQPKLQENNLTTSALESLDHKDSIGKGAELAFDIPDTVDEGKGTSKTNTPLTPQAFQVEYVRQLVNDAMEEQADVIRRYLQHLHVQWVRKSEEQNEHLERLFQKYTQKPRICDK